MLEEHTIEVAGLPPTLDGVRILQVSDLHLTRWLPGRDARAREALSGCLCDLVALTGDLVNSPREWDRLGAWLDTALPDAPRFAVPGNWDYRMSRSLDEMSAVLDRSGVELLLNRAVRVPVRDGVLTVVGLDDVRLGRLHVSAGFDGVEDGDIVVVLAHSPDTLLHVDSDRFHVMLSGHTHGGQVRLPRYGAVLTSTRLGKRFECGPYPLPGGSRLHVSRGIGTGWVPFRFWCPPELAILTLRPILGAKP